MSEEDTPEGCRAHAAHDRTGAGASDTENGRLRLERSAAAWDSRAHELEALAETSDVRRADAIAEWNEGEAADEAYGSDKDDPA